jgi:hypothetical protein
MARTTRLAAFLSASCLTAAFLALTAAPASAVVPQCLAPSGGRGCVSLTSDFLGSRYALGVNARRAGAGSTFLLSQRIASDAAQDFHQYYEGTVAQLENEDPGLLGSAISAPRLAGDPVYEFGYVNEQAALCIGITTPAAGNGATVALEPCGVSADTLWVIPGNLAGGYSAIINGTSAGALDALTAVAPGRGFRGTAAVAISALNQRIAQASQAWDARHSI